MELFANNDSDSNILDNEDDDNKSDKNNSPIKENNNQNTYQNYSYIDKDLYEKFNKILRLIFIQMKKL